MTRLQTLSALLVTLLAASPLLSYAKDQAPGKQETANSANSQEVVEKSGSTITCVSENNNLADIPASATSVSITITSPYVVGLCKDSQGQTLSVVTPKLPYTFDIAAGQTISVPYSVSNTAGTTANGSISYTRP